MLVLGIFIYIRVMEYTKFTKEEIEKAFSEVFYKDIKPGTGKIGIRDEGDGWYSINNGHSTIWTNKYGVEEFSKAMREEALRFLDKEDGAQPDLSR